MPAHAQISGRVPSNKFASRKHASAVSTVLSSEFSNRQMPAIRHASDVGVIFPDFRNQSPAFWYSSPSNKILPILKQSTASFEVLAAWTKVCDFSNASFAELKFALPPSRNSHSPNSTHASLLRSVTNSSKCFTAFFAFEKFCCSMYAFTIWSRQRSEDLVFFRQHQVLDCVGLLRVPWHVVEQEKHQLGQAKAKQHVHDVENALVLVVGQRANRRVAREGREPRLKLEWIGGFAAVQLGGVVLGIPPGVLRVAFYNPATDVFALQELGQGKFHGW
mmetsp:Transcript_26241/g.66112  ORF Transcript_26241/g.66112 Transcript_26241/m.66112 type:complete len:276 (+) Transcript_26241:930-1757(+)